MKLKSGKDIQGISKDAMETLMSYSWPGNVRELKSAFEYAFVTCHDSMIQPAHFPSNLTKNDKQTGAVKQSSINIHEIKKRELIEALEKAGGNKSRAAEFLGVSRVTVWNRMKRFNVDTPRQVKTVDPLQNN